MNTHRAEEVLRVRAQDSIVHDQLTGQDCHCYFPLLLDIVQSEWQLDAVE